VEGPMNHAQCHGFSSNETRAAEREHSRLENMISVLPVDNNPLKMYQDRVMLRWDRLYNMPKYMEPFPFSYLLNFIV